VADRQRDVMLEAFKRVSRNPQDVDYVELHATGERAIVSLFNGTNDHSL
jgi:acyl transferase domain-containing protein